MQLSSLNVLKLVLTIILSQLVVVVGYLLHEASDDEYGRMEYLLSAKSCSIAVLVDFLIFCRATRV